MTKLFRTFPPIYFLLWLRGIKRRRKFVYVRLDEPDGKVIKLPITRSEWIPSGKPKSKGADFTQLDPDGVDIDEVIDALPKSKGGLKRAVGDGFESRPGSEQRAARSKPPKIKSKHHETTVLIAPNKKTQKFMQKEYPGIEVVLETKVPMYNPPPKHLIKSEPLEDSGYIETPNKPPFEKPKRRKDIK